MTFYWAVINNFTLTVMKDHIAWKHVIKISFMPHIIEITTGGSSKILLEFFGENVKETSYQKSYWIRQNDM